MTTTPTHQEAVKVLRDALESMLRDPGPGMIDVKNARAALAATSQVEAATSEAAVPDAAAVRAAAMKEAAKHITKKAEDYHNEHGSQESDTGAWNYPGDGQDYINTLEELAEEIEALAAPLALPATEQVSTIPRMCEFKTDDLLKRGYRKVGYILLREDNQEYALSDSSVRWLTQPQYWRLMHEQDGSLFAQAAQAKPDLSGLVRHVCNLRDQRGMERDAIGAWVRYADVAALLAHPVAQAERPVIWEKKKNELGEFYQRSTDGLILHPYQYKAIFGSAAQAKPEARDAVLEEAAKKCEDIYSWDGAFRVGVLHTSCLGACASAIRALKAAPPAANGEKPGGSK